MRRRAHDHNRLETCPACKKDFVQPVSWEPEGDERWWMYLRCGECGMSREVSVSNADAERYEAALHSRASIISRALRRLEIDRMAAEVESFVTALQRDLIDAADFAR
jgi:hypothetical protein